MVKSAYALPRLRASNAVSGSHFGSTDVKFFWSRPASAKSAAQSGAVADPFASSSCGGTARNSISRPRPSKNKRSEERRVGKEYRAGRAQYGTEEGSKTR